MKKVFYSDIYNIKVIEKPAAVYKAIKEAKKVFTTYNQLMSYYEDGGRDIGVIFIASKDSVMFQHLPLFSEYFNVELYAFPNGSEDVLSSIFDKKYVNIVSLHRDDPAFQKFRSIDVKTIAK